MNRSGAARGRAAGFTLIELLVVVAIIAILAAIALPNLLEAQTRAKVSRVMADLRTAATAVQLYTVDYNHVPLNDGYYNILPPEVTTPIAYLSSNHLVDPFKVRDVNPVYGILSQFYTYTEIVDLDTAFQRDAIPRTVPLEAVDDPLYNPGAFEKYGPWRLVSDGPDRSYILPGHHSGDDPTDPFDRIEGIDVPYDPTNGTISGGNIMYTQRYGLTPHWPTR